MVDSPPTPDPVSEPVVIAAGALVVHRKAVLIVHRPKYDDWSFPKGKQEPGEHDVTTAVRETVEETGVEIRLGRPLSTTAYVQGDGRAKIVHYWQGEVIGDPDLSHFVPNSEVDEVRWVPLAGAASLLSYERDQPPLEALRTMPKRTTPLLVLRHAKAEGRRNWKGPDPERPLTELGAEQARALAPLLAAYGVTRVVSSSSNRCRQTLAPYADEHVLALGTTEVLSEEHRHPEDAADLVAGLLEDKEPTVVCTHRPVLPIVLERLGIAVPALEPAEMLVLHHRKGAVIAWERHRSPEPDS